jgi:hypothetical protein
MSVFVFIAICKTDKSDSEPGLVHLCLTRVEVLLAKRQEKLRCVTQEWVTSGIWVRACS